MRALAGETDDPDKMILRLTEMISAHPGYAGLVLLESDDQAGTLLTLRHTREDAEPASERSRVAAGPRPVELLTDDVYEVEEQVSGTATGPAEHALVAYFDGPMSPERAALARRSGWDRISPALRKVPGLIRTWVLWHPDAVKMTVVHLITSSGAVQNIITAVTSVRIAEDEDAARLTGPDRVGRHRVLAVAD